MYRDVFLCHASADKSTIVRQLARDLSDAGISVWYDEAEIPWGASLYAKIQEGLIISQFILVVVTPAFIAPEQGWRNQEVETAFSLQVGTNRTRVLPLVSSLSHAQLQENQPFLAARRYLRLDDVSGIPEVINELRSLVHTAKRVQIVSRAEVDTTIGTVEDRLAKASREVWISGNDSVFVAKSLSGFVLKVLQRGIKVRMMCVDPLSAAAEMLPLIDPRFPTADSFRRDVLSVEEGLKEWSDKFSFEFRYLPVLPSMGFFIIDPGSGQSIVKFEIYCAKPWEPIDSRPHILLGDGLTEWKEYFINQYRNYWALGRNPWE